jgi:cholesterol oxidase
MQWLSQKKEDLSEHYEVVIIGSGYGGAIAASRLSHEGYLVCLLERGREIVPGEYPNNIKQFLKEIQVDTRSGHYGPSSGLFDLRCNKELNVILGCGLGGSSLIDAGLCNRPDPIVFQDLVWPEAIRNEDMKLYYERAEAMLRPSFYKDEYPFLEKFDVLERSVNKRQVQDKISKAQVLINFNSLPNGLNHAGVKQNPCIYCGDCLTGCNYSAKNTLLMNYLPDAKRHGAHIFTHSDVSHIEQDQSSGGGPSYWKVFLKKGKGINRKESRAVISAKIVIISAGSLGSTEILLRSAEKGLHLSPTVGKRFSGNGNMVGLAFNTNISMNAVGFGSHAYQNRDAVGPCSVGFFDMRKGRDLQNGITLSEAVFPGAFSQWLPVLLSDLAKTIEINKNAGVRDVLREASRIIQSKIRGSYVGAVHNTQILLAVAHDNSGGKLILENNRVKLFWPGVSRQPEFYRINEIMREMTAQWGGTFIPNPIWDEILGHGLMSWNPLGGAVMADDAQHGVVNHKGQVYSSDRGLSVHTGLYVMDGSVIPRSLGVGPLLTIAALAERSCEQLIKSKK